jgi:hypothetical protein
MPIARRPVVSITVDIEDRVRGSFGDRDSLRAAVDSLRPATELVVCSVTTKVMAGL